MRISVALALLVAAGSMVACSRTDRPTAGEWQPRWEAAVAIPPAATELSSPVDRQTCDATLGALRRANVDLFPTPDAALDDVVRDWLQVAEDAFFECPPASTALPDFAAAYAELQRLEAEVDAVLSIDASSG